MEKPRHNRRTGGLARRSFSEGGSVRREISAGGVAVRREHDHWLVALLKTEHKRGAVWILPKGHVEPQAGETVAGAARREVQEEAGLTDLSVKEQLGITRYSFQAETALVRKTVHYFLMTTQQKKLTPQAEEGLIDATWQPIDRAIDMLAYDTDKQIVARARDRLLGKSTRRPVHSPRTSTHSHLKPRRIHT